MSVPPFEEGSCMKSASTMQGSHSVVDSHRIRMAGIKFVQLASHQFKMLAARFDSDIGVFFYC